jgi:hypothetical protein
MSDIKIRNDLPEPLPLDVMIDKINKILKTADYFDVYLTYIFFRLHRNGQEEKQAITI